ncbi:MAG: hypothetical protein IJ525_01285 [Alphaproteobacteria bacterium]|nr:hypothetical protein [Alphaproteobacteria bacterium]
MVTKHSKRIWPVNNPCMIVYRDILTGALSFRPYVDLSKKNSIWGIAMDGIFFKKTHDLDDCWTRAILKGDARSNSKMPTTTELDVAFYHKKAFSETVELLKSLKIPAEDWRGGWYWSSEDDGDKAVVINMADGKPSLANKDMPNGYLRLVGHKIKKNDFVNLHYPLVYIVDGELEPTLGFYPERRDTLWGIQVNKYFMRLTNEAKQLTWYEADSIAMASCTKKIKVKLPPCAFFEFIKKEADDINDTLAILGAYGIETDFVDPVFNCTTYLTSNELRRDCFETPDHYAAKKNFAYWCRFIAEKA